MDLSFDVNDERRRAAAQRSYTTPAIITLVLYFVLWLPGLTANFVYCLNARRDERLIGRAPDGKGCLVAMLWVFEVLSVVTVLLVGVVSCWRSHSSVSPGTSQGTAHQLYYLALPHP